MEVFAINQVLEKIKEIGIVPVVKIMDAKDALPLAKALCRGGLPCAEITFRTGAAAESIRRIKKQFPEILIGAGTVLTPEQADEAMDAGASFIVSPGLNPRVVKYCIQKGVLIIPGCANASDVELALDNDLNAVKFFPAEAAGGIKTIKALSAPYKDMWFMPTGGITPENLNTYLSDPHIIACGGSWMVKEPLIEAGRFDEIELLTRNAVRTMLGFRVVKVTTCTADKTPGALESANILSAIFCIPKDVSNNMPDMINAGGYGCLTVETNFLFRTVAYMERMGFPVEKNSAVYGKDEAMRSVSLKKQVAGFSIRLLQK